MNDSLGDRMKDYESIPRTRLVPKTPVLLRLDGKAFHTFTRGMERPYDARFHNCMWQTAAHLCAEIAGTRVAYVQSDEISLLVMDDANQSTQPWFDYEIQKMVSVSAAMAAVAFLSAMLETYPEPAKHLPAFDSRAWNVPSHEVVNYFIWRQQDASRNSLSMLAQAHFSHKQLHGVNTAGMHDLLMLQKSINWNDCPTPQKRGVCLTREVYEKPGEDGETVTRSRWVVDQDIPLFTADREYIQRFVTPKREEVSE